MQFLQESLDIARSVPAHDGRGNFVSQGVRQNGGMACATPGPVFDLLSDLPNHSPIVKKRVMALCLQPHQDSEAMPMGAVEEPPRWCGVSSHGIYAACGHHGKVLFHHLGRRKSDALFVRAKRPIGDASDVQLFLACPKEFAPCVDAIIVRSDSSLWVDFQPDCQ